MHTYAPTRTTSSCVVIVRVHLHPTRSLTPLTTPTDLALGSSPARAMARSKPCSCCGKRAICSRSHADMGCPRRPCVKLYLINPDWKHGCPHASKSQRASVWDVHYQTASDLTLSGGNCLADTKHDTATASHAALLVVTTGPTWRDCADWQDLWTSVLEICWCPQSDSTRGGNTKSPVG